MNLDRWLTSKRLRAHGLMLGLAIWSLYVWTLATPTLRDRSGLLKGTDFLHFYTLGTLAIEHRGRDLYDMSAQAAVAARCVPDAAGIRYLPLYPPQVSLLFVPLAHLSYGWALALWWLVCTLLYGVCCYSLWRVCPGLRACGGTVVALALAYPAFFNLIAWGQTSALALACFTGAFLLLRGGREFAAGLVLGCLIFKPQLGLAVAVVMVAAGAWKIVAVALLSAAAQVGCGIAYYGVGPLRDWIRNLSNLRNVIEQFEPRIYQTHSLRTFLSMILPSDRLAFVLYLIGAVVVLWWTVRIWKRRQSLPLRFSSLLLATVLVSPHLTVYDLVILAPAFLLLSNWLVTRNSPSSGFGILLYLAFMLPLLGPFTRWIHVQLSVVVMAALLYWIGRIREEDDSASPEEIVAAQAATT